MSEPNGRGIIKTNIPPGIHQGSRRVRDLCYSALLAYPDELRSVKRPHDSGLKGLNPGRRMLSFHIITLHIPFLDVPGLLPQIERDPILIFELFEIFGLIFEEGNAERVKAVKGVFVPGEKEELVIHLCQVGPELAVSLGLFSHLIEFALPALCRTLDDHIVSRVNRVKGARLDLTGLFRVLRAYLAIL